MDELTLLRDLDDDAPPPTPTARAAARGRLEEEIARKRRPRRSRRPLRPRQSWNGQTTGWVWLAVVVVFALVVVVRDMGGDDEFTAADLLQSEPSAEVLELAARDGAPIVPTATARRDQYVYTREITEGTPLDPGGTPRRFVEEEWLAVDTNVESRTCEIGRCWMASGMGLPSTEEFERIPRDPGRLILYAKAQFDPSPPTGPLTEDDWMMAAPFFVSLFTTSVIVPPDLRAALVEALAYAPHASVIDDELEFRGRPAAVIDIPPFGSDLILDRDTHEYLGSRWELGPSDMKGRNGRLFRSSRVRFDSYLVETGVVDRMGERP
jgi:hypothetical protein